MRCLHFFDLVGDHERERFQVVLQTVHGGTGKLLPAFYSDQLCDHIGCLLAPIRRFAPLPFTHRLKDRVTERLNNFTGEAVGLAVIKRHRALHPLLQRLRHFLSQISRLRQGRTRVRRPTPTGVVPDDHASARRKASGGNIVTLDCCATKRLLHGLGSSQTVTRPIETHFHRVKMVEARGVEPLS